MHKACISCCQKNEPIVWVKSVFLAYLQAGIVKQVCSRVGANLLESLFQMFNIYVMGDL